MADDKNLPEDDDKDIIEGEASEVDESDEHDESDQDDEHDEGGDEQEADGGDSDEDPEREAIRERRRAERQAKKRHRQEKEESYRRELAARDRVIEEMSERLSQVERKSSGSEMAQLDNAIKQAGAAYQHFRDVLKNAVEAQDGEAAVQAQERMAIAQRRFEDLNRVKTAYGQRQQQPQALDPRMLNHAQGWMEQHNWYDPSGRDQDSRVVLTLDNQLASEGWNPTTPEYWEELNSRVKKYLPHRFSGGNIRNNGKPQARKSPVAGSGRDSASGKEGTYKLSADRVNALKDAGIWDDPAQRAEAIKRFREYDRANGIK